MSDFLQSNSRGENWWQLGNIFSVKAVRGGFEWAEECDYWHKTILSKEDSLKLIDKLRAYIEKS